MRKIKIIIIAALIGVSGYYLYTHKDTRPSISWHRTAKKNFNFDKWVSFKPDGEEFKASFPGKPESSNRDLPVPRSDDTLPYQEYKYTREDSCLFSVSYATLPEDWLKYGDSLILGGALKIVMHELGMSNLVGKSSLSFKSYPALDYQYYKDDTESAGTLILIGTTLYKVEMVYPRDMHNDVQEELINFIENFTPTTSAQPEN